MTAALSPAGVLVDRRVMRLAALFVQADGCYAGRDDIDAWPEHRDARRYAGPLPVVAHPPCQLWGAMAAVNFARWGGEHNRPGNDGGCFSAALEAVRKFGGVLEHPAKTKAWAAHGLAKPAGIGWQRTIDGGWVCEVWQSAYGHRANKATWLYYHGTNQPFELRWERPKGTHQIGFRDQRGKAANKPTLGKREANATPLEFRDELERLAMTAHNAKLENSMETQPGCGQRLRHRIGLWLRPIDTKKDVDRFQRYETGQGYGMKNAISHAYEIIEMAREIERLRFEVDRLQDIETKYQQLLDTSISHSEHMMGEMLTMAIELTKTEVLK